MSGPGPIPSVATGSRTTSDIDTPFGDTDLDVLHLGVQSGGEILGTFDPDGDGEPEVLFQDSGLPTGTIASIDVDTPSGDTDLDVLRLGTQSGGTIAGLADLDGDGEQELLFEDPTLTTAAKATRDVDTPPGDTDLDVLRPGGPCVPRELAEIAVLTADLARLFDVEPRVAMLSFSNFGSNAHEARRSPKGGIG